MQRYLLILAFFSPLIFSQHAVDSSFVASADDGTATQVAFKFGCFFSFDVRGFCVVAHNLACAGYFKPLFGGTACFNFWHYYFSFGVFKKSMDARSDA
jgi:hypothetical protein